MYKPELESFMDNPEVHFEITCCECGEPLKTVFTAWDWEFSVGFELYDKKISDAGWKKAKDCGRETKREDLILCPNCSKK